MGLVTLRTDSHTSGDVLLVQQSCAEKEKIQIQFSKITAKWS